MPYAPITDSAHLQISLSFHSLGLGRYAWNPSAIGGLQIFWRYLNDMTVRILRRNFSVATRAIAPPTGRPLRLDGRAPRFAGSPGTGGWSFAVDPDSSAENAPALWRPELCPSIAIAAPAPSGFAGPAVSDVLASGTIAAEFLAHREWHLVIATDGYHLRLWVADCLANEALAYIVPSDGHVPERQAATGLLDSWLVARAVSESVCQPGPSERWRMAQWLRLLDAMAENVPARDLAAALILPDARYYSSAEWDVSSERRRIARWHRSAVAMRDGGYLNLLAGH